MDETLDQEKSILDDNNKEEDDGTKYADCIQFMEGGHLRRFESLAAKFDIVQYELNDTDKGPTKPLIFYAIERKDEKFVKILLQMEIPLHKSYTVSSYIQC